MNQLEAGKELKRIEEIAVKIMAKQSSQTCGTEYQKWSYALLKAQKEYYGVK